MRHNNVGRKLGRTAPHRKRTLAALSTALIKHKKIRTTKAKAKETRRIIEPLITRARNAYQREQNGQAVDVHARREIARFIQDKDAVQLLFSEIAEKVGLRQGGYTRVLKLGRRLGDGAEMAVIELVDYNTAQDEKRRKARVAGQKKADERKKRLEGQKRSQEKAVASETETEEETVETEGASATEQVEAQEVPPTAEPETSEAATVEPAAEEPAEEKAVAKEEEPKAEAAAEEAPKTEESAPEQKDEGEEEDKKE